MKASFLTCALALIVALPAGAQTSPSFPEKDKTLRIVVPFAAGGGVDNVARLLAEQLRKQFGAAVIVDNKPGASGTIGGRHVQMAPPDGYTLLFSAATHVHAKQVLANVPYDPQADFTPVARVAEAPLLLVIAPQLPQRKLADVVAATKQAPDKWLVAIPATGAPSHLATLLLARETGAKLTYVPYKGTQPALVDVAGGHVSLLLDSVISLQSLAKSGKVTPIAITSTKRSALMPNVPTVQESGVPKFSYVSWYGVWAPKATPPDRVNAINSMLNRAVQEVAKTSAFTDLGIEPVSETPEQFKRYIAADVTQGGELLTSAGFKPE